MERPIVSVIIPAYNSAKYIKEAVESVFRQAVPLELIIIDDASTDETPAVLCKYQTREEFILLSNEKNLGVAESRNLGVQKARGEYIAFLDADDWWEANKLAEQLETLQKTDTVICSTAREIVDQEGNLTGNVLDTREHITYQMMLYQNWLNCSAVLVKTEVMKEFPMQNDDSHEDYITWMRILKKYKEASGINKPLLKYRLSNTGKSGTKRNSAKMMYRAYRHLGFGCIKSAFYFCAYVINGMRKYYWDRGEFK